MPAALGQELCQGQLKQVKDSAKTLSHSSLSLRVHQVFRPFKGQVIPVRSYRWSDLNRQGFPRRILSAVRLPIPPHLLIRSF